MSKPDLYFSIDIETNGPIPLEYSMLSLGAVALTAEGEELGTYSATLDLLPGAKEHPPTMAWWAQSRHAGAWKAARENTRPPQHVMQEFVAWVKKICGDKYSPVFVAFPAGFDFTFMYVYLVKFTGESPFSFAAFDMKSFAKPLLGTQFRETTKKRFPKAWMPPTQKHTHVALEDAREQGYIFIKMLEYAEHRAELADRAEQLEAASGQRVSR